MKTRGSGVIVNIGWDQAERGMAGESGELFAAIKGAVMAFSNSLARSLAPQVRVNCVTPAAVKTAIFDQMSQQHIDFMLSKIPLGRFGQVEEIASLVAWLASEECSFSTGAVFDLSGGRATY